MSISELWPKIKGYTEYIGKRDIYTVLLIIFTGTGCFFLGMLYEKDISAPPIKIIQNSLINENFSAKDTVDNGVSVSRSGASEASKTIQTVSETQPVKVSPNTSVAGVYVGSKNSNKFHLPTCPGAKQISEANKVWFQTKEEATAKGYIPAGNCPGI